VASSPQYKVKETHSKLKYVRNPANDPCHNSITKYRRQDREDRGKHKIIRYGDVVNSDESDFEQPSDENENVEVLSKERIA
jgi:hypothetical protein